MIRFQGGWYCDAQPNGAWVALITDSHLETDAGRVELPRGQNLLYVRMAPNGLRFAGVGHHDDHCWQWNVILRRWDDHGLAFGPRAVGYTPDSGLVVVRHAPAHGWRNWPVTAEQSYADRGRAVWEYTDFPGLTIGQGGDGPHGDDPCIALLDGRRRLIEDGRCRAINASESGRVAIAYSREDTREAVIRWMSRDEIAALPMAQTNAPAPRPVPVPVPEPQPEPEPVPIENGLDIIRQIRADYPTPLGARHWEFLVEVAQTLDVQLYRKEDSNAVLIPALGKRVSLDVIGRGALGNTWVDILADSENLAIPVWQEHQGAGGEYVDVSQVELPGEAPPPAPLPTPGTPVPTPGTLEQRVDALEAWKARVQA